MIFSIYEFFKKSNDKNYLQIIADAYHEGWIFRLKPVDISHLDNLMGADENAELVESESH